MNVDGMSEETWQGQFLTLAAMLGWETMHVRKSLGRRGGARAWQTTTSVRGWPDVICWRPGRLLAVELKSETGTTTSEQRDVLGSLRAAGMESYVWKPSDLEEAKRVLSRRAAA